MNPYNEIEKNGKYIRTFNKDVVSEELVWHRDREDRVVKILSENDWLFQFDNELPIKLMVNESITIPKNTYHRVIKGSTDLVVEVTKFYDFGFNDLPPDIIKILKNEYSHIYMDRFDWNKKQDEFTDNGVYDGKAFNEWYRNYESSQFSKNIDVLTQKVREDLITIIKRRNAEKVLSKFEELIIPVLGNEVLVGPISKFMEIALLNLHSTNEIEKAYRESKNIIDNGGSINQSKITQSGIFVGDVISLPNFEKFVENNPEYRGVFNDWKKLFDMEIELSLKNLNAFRDSIKYDNIKPLYDYLINLKKGNMGNINESEPNNPCWDGYEMVGMKDKGGKEVPNCVPVSEELISDKEFSNFTENYKNMIKSKLTEAFGESKPVVRPGVKTNEPKVSPRKKRIWEAKPSVTPPGKM